MQLRAKASKSSGSSSNPKRPKNSKLADTPSHTKALQRRVRSSNFSEDNSKPNNAGVSLHTSQVEAVVGRENEIDLLRSSILPWISGRSNGGIYVSGAPGTGKTATVAQVVQQLTNQKQCRSVFLNCMQMSSPGEVYSCIIKRLGENDIRHVSSQDKFVTHVESLLTKFSKRLPLILVLDEIDQLASRHQDILYRIFGWPDNLKGAHIILIGIANALDLTELVLPGLRARSLKPVCITFPPYSKDQIAQIIKSRITPVSKDNSEPTIDEIAIQFCARKVAASSGDVRTALAICQRALELARLEACSKPDTALRGSQLSPRNLTPLQQRIMCSPSVRMSLKKKRLQPSNLANLPNGEKEGMNEFIVPTIKHISQAILESQPGGEAALTCPNSPSLSSSGMPLHHKLVLASLLLLRRLRNMREAKIGQVFEVYTYVCSQRGQLAPLEMSEFVSVCGLLEARGLVRLSTPGVRSATLLTPARVKCMALLLDDRGVERSLDDNLLLSSILAIQSLP
ncbi:hypothetical protein Aperf_G00000033232 [Anoplocephala perfoliata]